MFLINLNFRDPRPIYEQIKEGFRQLIVSGGLTRDERLPSVRELATQLAINPNTIQRAYRELESEGYIYSIPGKGSFTANVSEIDTGRRDKLLESFDSTVSELRYLGVTAEELSRRINRSFSENENTSKPGGGDQ